MANSSIYTLISLHKSCNWKLWLKQWLTRPWKGKIMHFTQHNCERCLTVLVVLTLFVEPLQNICINLLLAWFHLILNCREIARQASFFGLISINSLSDWHFFLCWTVWTPSLWDLKSKKVLYSLFPFLYFTTLGFQVILLRCFGFIYSPKTDSFFISYLPQVK